MQKKWYAAHSIMYVRFKDTEQDRYPVWENVFLIEAESYEEAFEKAEKRAQEDEGDSSGTFVWSGQPAIWVFGGIRKLVAFESPTSEEEVTYIEMTLASESDLRKLINGEEVSLTLLSVRTHQDD